jgi:hypothetical protein
MQQLKLRGLGEYHEIGEGLKADDFHATEMKEDPQETWGEIGRNS